MKSFLSIPFILLLIISPYRVNAKDIHFTNTDAQVYFSPNGGCADAIVKELGKAKSEILVQAYSFTSKKISKALLDAHKREVITQIILDHSNISGKYSAGDFTAHAGIPTFIDSDHAIAHNKIIIIDRETVITGSFNSTNAAENNNAENLLIIRSKELAMTYIDNWNVHRKHSEVYEGK